MVNRVVESITSWFGNGQQKASAMWLFERLVFLWFIIHALSYWEIKHLLWGNESFFMIPNYNQDIIRNLFYLITYSKWIGPYVYLIHLGAAVLAFFGWLRFIPKAIVYLSGFMLYYAAWPVFNSGLLLCLLYAFFLIFHRAFARSSTGQVFSNFALVACMVQLLLVYLESSVYKMSGSMWWEGSALYYGLHLEQFTSEGTRSFFEGKNTLIMILNYLAFAYQALFIVLVWFKRIKYYFLAAGLLFHLFIAIFMNLPDFGTAMIIGYVLFLDEDVVANWVRKVSGLKAVFPGLGRIRQ